MHFRIQGLAAEEFAPLFSMSDTELAERGAVRRIADARERGYPCRVSLTDSKPGDELIVEADVKNTSARDGDEVAELYLVPPKDGVAPKLALESFSRLHMKAGETRHVKFVLDARQMSVVDAAGVRAVRAGTYGVALGGGQPSEAADLSGQFTVEGMKALPR